MEQHHDRVMCECGAVLHYKNLGRHLNSERHMNYLGYLTEQWMADELEREQQVQDDDNALNLLQLQ